MRNEVMNLVNWETRPGRYTMLLERGDAARNIARPSQFLYGPMRIEYIVHKDGGIDATMHDYDPEE